MAKAKHKPKSKQTGKVAFMNNVPEVTEQDLVPFFETPRKLVVTKNESASLTEDDFKHVIEYKEKLYPEDPVSNVVWIHRDQLKANDYNPNAVAPPEMRLLEISILEDGWTQPIVRNPDNTIVDGFHRYTVSGTKALMAKYHGYVPTVIMKPTNETHQRMSTIRHNRARGTHAVLKMADIVAKMIEIDNLTVPEIMKRLQMEREEVIRLASRMGIPATKLREGKDFGKSWEPGEQSNE